MRHGGRTTLVRAVFPIAQPQSPRPCIFPPPAPPAKPASRQGLALTTPHALARIRRPSLPNDPNGRYASRTRPRTAHPYPCPVHPFADPPPPTCASPRDRKRLVRALAAFAHRRPAPRRPALPRATANRLPTLLPRPLIRRPLSPADLRFPRATANVPARGFSQAPGGGLRPSGMALAVPPRHVGQKMFKFYNSLKIALSPVDSGMHACYNVPSGYPVVCATPVLLPTDSKKDSGSVSVDAMPPISDRPGKAANGRRSPPCLSGG